MKIRVKWQLATVLLGFVGTACSYNALGETVFSQSVLPATQLSRVHSNAVTHPDGSDQDVTTYDNFTLSKSARVTTVTWRGASSERGLAGFTIKLYPSRLDASRQPDTANPLAVLTVLGASGEQPVGNDQSDFSADFSAPVLLNAGEQYWISIVSDRKDLSPWSWTDGAGGDGKSIQAYSEFKVLPAPGDRAFALGTDHQVTKP